MSWSGCSATSGSRLFMSIRMAASCGQPRQVSAVPRGARTGRGPEAAPPAGVAVIGGSSSSQLSSSQSSGRRRHRLNDLAGSPGPRDSSSPVRSRPGGPGGRGGRDMAGAVEGAGEYGPDVVPGRRPRRVGQYLIVEGVRGDAAEIGGGDPKV